MLADKIRDKSQDQQQQQEKNRVQTPKEKLQKNPGRIISRREGVEKSRRSLPLQNKKILKMEANDHVDVVHLDLKDSTIAKQSR